MIGMVLAAVGVEPSWGDLAVLGTYALALIVGYYGAYRFQVLHERAQCAQERERTKQEREERREAEARERKTQEAALPALLEANRALKEMGLILDRQTRP